MPAADGCCGSYCWPPACSFCLLLVADQLPADPRGLAGHLEVWDRVHRRTQWIPNLKEFGAWPELYGTLITSVFSLIFATGLGIAIGLFLSMLAPRSVAAVVGPLVEMLAAIPSIVIGLIGVYLIAPFVRSTLEAPLHSAFGFLPFFGPAEPVGNSLFTGILVLTIMVLPIIAALTRDVFLTVPQELRDGAEALGATRWEVIRAWCCRRR